jgi:hypothetical protein
VSQTENVPTKSSVFLTPAFNPLARLDTVGGPPMLDLPGSEPPADNPQDALGSEMTAEVREVRVTGPRHWVPNLTEEHPEDRAARLAREAREHLFGLWVKGATFLLLALVLLYSGWRLQDPALDPETRRLGVATVTSILTGFLGYLAGRRG